LEEEQKKDRVESDGSHWNLLMVFCSLSAIPL